MKNRNQELRPLLLTAILVWLMGLTSTFAQAPIPEERAIRLFVDVKAPVDSVWSRWTTPAGRARFFAPASQMELSTLGFMEILFDPSKPVGQRGAENNRILAFQPNQLLSFTWDAPPMYPEIRKQRTVVIIRFVKLSASETRVLFHQTGWGSGTDWDAVFTYFSQAWKFVVLPNLKYSLESGSIDWTDFPNRLPRNLPPASEIK